ncbi:MAG: tryptophan synthase subunit alpha [Dehalococcoidales bacterium]|nr:tryptophan synthase subunit alpha [Dehalococcoidales bacterium]
MNRIDAVFNKKGHKALIAYVTVGYPSIEATMKIVPLLADSCCDIIELGIPFSDPMADGATIQHASYCALQNGITPKKCLDMVKELRKKTDVPLVFMTYYNPVYNYGLDKFCKDSIASGIDGLIIPDLTPDEGGELEYITGKQGMDLIYLLSPTSTKERIELVARKSRGFIYMVSLTGVTGTRDNMKLDIDNFIADVRKATANPLCVGFGISTPEQARQVSRLADGVIIGSQIIKLMEKDDDFASVGKFIKKTRQTMDG